MRQTYLATGDDSSAAFDVPPEVYGGDLDRVTVTLKSLQLSGAGAVRVLLSGDDQPPTYFSTSLIQPDGVLRSSNSGLSVPVRSTSEGLHGHMHITRNHSSGATDVWVASWTFRLSQEAVIIGAGNTYFFGRLKRLVVAAGPDRLVSGNIGILYG